MSEPLYKFFFLHYWSWATFDLIEYSTTAAVCHAASSSIVPFQQSLGPRITAIFVPDVADTHKPSLSQIKKKKDPGGLCWWVLSRSVWVKELWINQSNICISSPLLPFITWEEGKGRLLKIKKTASHPFINLFHVFLPISWPFFLQEQQINKCIHDINKHKYARNTAHTEKDTNAPLPFCRWSLFACLHNFPESAPLTVVCLEATVPSTSAKIYSISDSYYSISDSYYSY